MKALLAKLEKAGYRAFSRKIQGKLFKIQNNTFDIQQYLDTQHPYVLPNFIDVFEWSIPFLC